MERIREDEILIRRYLMGEASQEEQCLIEQRLLTDREYFNTLIKVEEDLIDEYAAGETIEKEKFESHFLNAPERRERVEFARALSRYISAEKIRERSKANSPISAKPLWQGRLIQALSAGAVLLMVASTLWLLIERSRLLARIERQQSEFRQREEELKRQADEQLSRNEEMTRQLDSDKTEIARMEEEIARLERGGQRDENAVSLVLVPGLSRDQNQVATANLSPAAKSLRLELETDGENYPSYRVVVQTAEGETLWSRDSLRARRAGKSVVITLPAALLARSDYLVALDGRRADRYERVSTYFFRVVRKQTSR